MMETITLQPPGEHSHPVKIPMTVGMEGELKPTEKLNFRKPRDVEVSKSIAAVL